MSEAHQKYHLLTGATGLLGRYLLRDLTLADVPLAVVARPSKVESAAQRIETAMSHWERVHGRSLLRPVVLAGDITTAGLGLSTRETAWVEQHVETMIHSAASLTFYAEDGDGEPWRSNLGGTRNVLELCRRHGIRNMHHVSTAYVCGQRRGQVLESELDVGQEPSNDYEASKIQAEKEVLAADCFDNITVHRPSIIVGDSQTAYTTSFHGFYTPLRLGHTLVQTVAPETVTDSNWLGGLDLDGNERKNLVPVDWVSAAMTFLITHPELHGQTYHLTNPQPATVAEMFGTMAFALLPLLSGDKKPRIDKLQSDEMLASFRDQMGVYQSYWSDDPEFDSRRTQAAMPHLPCPRIDEEIMQRLIQYAIDANFGWPKETPAIAKHNIADQLRNWDSAIQESPADETAVEFIGLCVSGSGGGQWRLSVADGHLTSISEGLAGNRSPTCYLRSDCFMQLVGGDLTCDTAIQTGRLVVTELSAAMPLRRIKRILGELSNVAELIE